MPPLFNWVFELISPPSTTPEARCWNPPACLCLFWPPGLRRSGVINMLMMHALHTCVHGTHGAARVASICRTCCVKSWKKKNQTESSRERAVSQCVFKRGALILWTLEGKRKHKDGESLSVKPAPFLQHEKIKKLTINTEKSVQGCCRAQNNLPDTFLGLQWFLPTKDKMFITERMCSSPVRAGAVW